MLQSALRSDALTSTGTGFELRIGLPWIRSMPLSGVSDLTVAIDGDQLPDDDLHVVLGSRRVGPRAVGEAESWWFLQDRLVLAGGRMLRPGPHAVSVGFRLLVPYLQAGPGAPLVLPFTLEAELLLNATPVPSVSRDVA
jgi:hypothetical protein